jgi:hypothetical protein
VTAGVASDDQKRHLPGQRHLDEAVVDVAVRGGSSRPMRSSLKDNELGTTRPQIPADVKIVRANLIDRPQSAPPLEYSNGLSAAGWNRVGALPSVAAM